MRQKVNDNFLKGGSSFYYRDIFSGLGNEKMGPALSMVSYYYPLLLRFGCRLFKEHSIVEELVKKVLQDQYELDGLQPSKNLRSILKNDLLTHINFHKQSNILDRAVLQVPMRNASVHWLKCIYERKPKNPT